MWTDQRPADSYNKFRLLSEYWGGGGAPKSLFEISTWKSLSVQFICGHFNNCYVSYGNVSNFPPDPTKNVDDQFERPLLGLKINTTLTDGKWQRK